MSGVMCAATCSSLRMQSPALISADVLMQMLAASVECHPCMLHIAC